MIGCYDFCGHYEWTFEWLHGQGGHDLVREYWDEAIHRDSQTHAAELIREGGFEGMERYWGHTLGEEGGQWHVTRQEGLFRIDMHDCPSKGFLLRNGLKSYPDYCDHCMGWIGPLMREAGYTLSHQHNHGGQCWWEMRRQGDASPASPVGAVSGAQDVRQRADWQPPGVNLDSYENATDPDDKLPAAAAES
jgi:hypothetical protein